jgi:transposase
MGEFMKQLKTYTPELREEAVKLVLAQGLTLEEAALRLAISKGTLANWVSAAKRGSTPKAAPGSRTVPELEAEVAKLRRELADARMERDIVKAWAESRHLASLQWLHCREPLGARK